MATEFLRSVPWQVVLNKRVYWVVFVPTMQSVQPPVNEALHLPVVSAEVSGAAIHAFLRVEARSSLEYVRWLVQEQESACTTILDIRSGNTWEL